MNKKANRQKAKKEKSRKQKSRKLFISLIALGLGGLLIVTMFFFVLQNGTPKLAVAQEQIDFGDLKHNTKKTFTINVSNTGDGVLEFEKQPFIKVLQGC